MAKEIKAKGLQKGYLELLTNIYAKQKNFAKAYSFSHELNALKDSINNEEKIKQVILLWALLPALCFAQWLKVLTDVRIEKQ